MAQNIASGPVLELTKVVGIDASGYGGLKNVSDFATAAQGAKADSALQSANNLSDLPNATVARTNLGLGTAATSASTAFATAAQGTLASNATQKAANLSDIASPSTALNNLGGAPLASPALTGNPTAPTQAARDNSTKIATTAYVDTASRSVSCVIEDQKSSGVDAGASVVGLQTRTLNTKVYDPSSLVTLSSNQFTPSVDMWCEFRTPAFSAGPQKARLYCVTDSVYVGEGSSERVGASVSAQTNSVGGCAVTAGKTYRLDQYTGTAVATFGLGLAVGSGTEVYSRILLWRR